LKWILYSFLLLAGCNPVINPEIPDPGYDYFPLVTGNFWEYKTEQIVYTPAEGKVESTEWLRVKIEDAVENTDQSVTYHLTNAVKLTETGAWEITKAWIIRADYNQLICTIDNLPLVILAFPANLGKTWDGNAFNTIDPENFEIIDKGSYVSDLLGQAFNDVITVKQRDNQDFIVNFEQDLVKYGKGIGPLYRSVKNLVYCQEISCLGLQQVNEGYEYVQFLTDYGVE